MYAQQTGNSRIAWGGTRKDDWKRNQNCVTFHFSDPSYRLDFFNEACRLLPEDLFKKVSENDNDPAKPSNRR
jgi:hypothetical protein